MSKLSITSLIKNVALTEGYGDFADYGVPVEGDVDRYNWKLNTHSDTSLEFIPFQGSDLEMEMGKGNDEFDNYRRGESEKGEQIHEAKAVKVSRVPSVDALMTAFGKFYRHEQGKALMTTEEAHKVMAVMMAANHAMKLDLLPQDKWRGKRHHAAKAGELVQRLEQMDVIRTTNDRPDIVISFPEIAKKRAAMKESIMENAIGSLDELLKAAKEMGKAPKPTFTNSPGVVSTMDLIKSLNGVRLPVKTSEVWAVNGYNDHGVKTTTFYTRTGKGPNDFRIKEITDRKHFKK